MFFVSHFTAAGNSEPMEMDEHGVEEIKKDMLNLLGMKEVPSIVISPHFMPHNSQTLSTVQSLEKNRLWSFLKNCFSRISLYCC